MCLDDHAWFLLTSRSEIVAPLRYGKDRDPLCWGSFTYTFDWTSAVATSHPHDHSKSIYPVIE